MSKLVRSKLDTVYPDNVYRKVKSKEEHLELLHVKVLEEAFEVADAIILKGKDDIVEEFADLLQVISDYIIIADVGIEVGEIYQKITEKSFEKGDFKGGLIMEECSLWEEK